MKDNSCDRIVWLSNTIMLAIAAQNDLRAGRKELVLTENESMRDIALERLKIDAKLLLLMEQERLEHPERYVRPKAEEEKK
jgi:hypothetical protein